jgi:XTP/dITP diphosphohydrolase
VKLLIATTNSGKVREFREMLGEGMGVDRFEWSDLSQHRGNSLETVPETGNTFRANACLKASGYARQLNCWALADDSGLAVDALGGKPGVHSARWAEMHQSGKGDAANNALLLRQLQDIPDDQRGGRFVCVLALSDPLGRIILTTMDWVQGRILRSGRGANGFGYDPLFYFPDLGKTTAELSPDQKHAISHRGKALKRMKGLMESLDWQKVAGD